MRTLATAYAIAAGIYACLMYYAASRHGKDMGWADWIAAICLGAMWPVSFAMILVGVHKRIRARMAFDRHYRETLKKGTANGDSEEKNP